MRLTLQRGEGWRRSRTEFGLGQLSRDFEASQRSSSWAGRWTYRFGVQVFMTQLRCLPAHPHPRTVTTSFSRVPEEFSQTTLSEHLSKPPWTQAHACVIDAELQAQVTHSHSRSTDGWQLIAVSLPTKPILPRLCLLSDSG